ncbi:hypothetical protein C8J56DRAFT_1024763 [Mycena floridula]|nr:hypothetical protein C8J56DRAFT_1024763 [Mycena floridula]
MAGTKRSAEDSGPNTRASKSSKKDANVSPGSKPKKAAPKKAAKPPMPTAAFKAKAMPLHVNLTHTPPTLPEADGEEPSPHADSGFIGNLTLVASSFNTGSYGWKGTKRLKITLQGEGGDEVVDVQLQINATVLKSKQADADPKDEESKEAAEEAADAEVDADEEKADE